MYYDFEVFFAEEKINRNGREESIIMEKLVISDSYGFLKYRIEDIHKSRLLDDIRAFYIEFQGYAPQDDRSAWADPLRIMTLERLMGHDLNWYVSFYGDMPNLLEPGEYKSIDQEIKEDFYMQYNLNYIEILSNEFGGKTYPRLFLELPLHLMNTIYTRYWPRAYPAFPIQGLLMEPGQVNLIQKWANQPHDAQHFREIIDQVQMMFYTYPSENRDFAFITNKLDIRMMLDLIHPDDLNQKAQQIAIEKRA